MSQFETLDLDTISEDVDVNVNQEVDVNVNDSCQEGKHSDSESESNNSDDQVGFEIFFERNRPIVIQIQKITMMNLKTI